MNRFVPRWSIVWLVVVISWLCAGIATYGVADEPVHYSLRFPDPEKHLAEVKAEFPTSGEVLELMMPIWSPGFYRVEDYAGKVKVTSATNADGANLTVTRPRGNRWRIATDGATRVVVTYELVCDAHSVTQNWLSKDLLVLNGPATFMTIADQAERPCEVRLDLAPHWTGSATGLAAAPDGKADHYVAANYDTLADSPIVAGVLATSEFTVGKSLHSIVDAGDYQRFDRSKSAEALEKIVRETERYWGTLPFDRFVFLNVFRRGGGGLEHANSTLLTSSPNMRAPSVGWLSFVAHEYVHAFNVKRLRPVELSKFDYERPPTTSGLWVSEGLTTYCADLIVARAGLCDTKGYLGLLTSHINSLQRSPGRLKQTLDQASLEVWNSGTSGVVRDPQNMVSYYVKGPVVGFVLDAKIRKATDGAKSLDDVMRLAYSRYSGETGFTADEFRKVAEEVAGIDLKPAFQRWLASTDEIDYSEALEWFGLEFAVNDKGENTWKLQVRPNATEAQAMRLKQWIGQM